MLRHLSSLLHKPTPPAGKPPTRRQDPEQKKHKFAELVGIKAAPRPPPEQPSTEPFVPTRTSLRGAQSTLTSEAPTLPEEPLGQRPPDPLPPDPPRELDQTLDASPPWLDPGFRAIALDLAANPGAPEAPAARPSLELPELLRQSRRVAWGGDGRRGTARIELGTGALAGAVLLVQVDAREVDIELELPSGVIAPELAERLRARLGARGFTVRHAHVG